jgi:DNA-binding CsgD family transcriptional regulator
MKKWSARYDTVFRIFVISAIPTTILSYFTSGVPALVFQFLSTALDAAGISVCLNQAASGAIPLERIGRFFGGAFGIMTLSVAVIFFLPIVEIPTGAVVILLCLFLALAAIFFKSGRPDMSQPNDDASAANSIPRKVVLIAGGVICLYAVISGLLDNIYFFESAFNKIPHFLFYIYIYESAISIIGGYAIDKYKFSQVGAAAFLLICVGQSMSFFSQNELLVIPYTIFSDAGIVTLASMAAGLPVFYCAKAGYAGILPGFGYISMFAGYLFTSLAFEFLPEHLYKPVLGISLLVSLGAAYAVLYAASSYDKYRYERLLKRNPATVNYKDKYGFTQRECEVLDYLSSGNMTSEIAARMSISERTVNFHIGSMLKKTGARNRVELIAQINERP